MMFTIFDITIFTIVAISSIFGLYKGMLNIVINLLGFIASIIAAILLFPYIKSTFSAHIANDLAASILSGIVAYVFSLVVLTFITSKIVALFSSASHGFLDRTLGVLFGILRGLIISIVIFAVVAILSSGSYLKAKNAMSLIEGLDKSKYPDWLAESKTSQFLEKVLKYSINSLPENTLESITLPSSPSNTKEDEDIIDEIKRTKEESLDTNQE
jgi:uncharacterized membrane protein required for colicin V production